MYGMNSKSLWHECYIVFVHQTFIRRQLDSSCGAPQVVLVVRNLPANVGDLRDMSLIPKLGRFSGGGHGNPRQYSCLENLMDRGAWWVTAHRVTESDTNEATQHALYISWRFWED